MPDGRARYEPFAWWLTRERIWAGTLFCFIREAEREHRLASKPRFDGDKPQKGTVRKEDTMNEDTASRTARENFDKTLATGAETVRGVQEGVTSALENVRDLNVRLIDMARANTDAAFDFAREVAEAKAPSDLVQVWTTHATKQFDMLTKQAGELTRLGQQFASTSSEPVTRRVGQASKR
jgi:hypothetical protein